MTTFWTYHIYKMYINNIYIYIYIYNISQIYIYTYILYIYTHLSNNFWRNYRKCRLTETESVSRNFHSSMKWKWNEMQWNAKYQFIPHRYTVNGFDKLGNMKRTVWFDFFQ